jgi:hypothetical protein
VHRCLCPADRPFSPPLTLRSRTSISVTERKIAKRAATRHRCRFVGQSNTDRSAGWQCGARTPGNMDFLGRITRAEGRLLLTGGNTSPQTGRPEPNDLLGVATVSVKDSGCGIGCPRIMPRGDAGSGSPRLSTPTTRLTIRRRTDCLRLQARRPNPSSAQSPTMPRGN